MNFWWASLLGVILGWFLNEVSYLIRFKREDRKNLKEILSNLLSIFHIIYANHVYTYKVAEKVYERLPKELKSERIEPLFKLMSQEYNKHFMQRIIQADTREVRERYRSSVNSLRGIDPLGAYKLTLRSSALDYLNAIDEMPNEIKHLMSDWKEMNNANYEEFLKFVRSRLKPRATEEVTNVLEDDIRGVSFKIGILTWLKVKKELKNTKNETPKIIEDILDKLFNDFKDDKEGS
ncbi:hypothetical protein ES707_14006 [subsurface metagenome]